MSSLKKKTIIKYISIVIAFLVLAIIFVASFRFKDVLNPDPLIEVALDESCDLRVGACTSILPNGGKVSFSISPEDIPILSPLSLRVTAENIRVSGIDVDFVGVGMDMGFNRSRLMPSQKENPNQFSGKGTLPVCSRSRMDWEARLLLNTEEGFVMVPFRFYTEK